jgi:hypothetical protein
LQLGFRQRPAHETVTLPDKTTHHAGSSGVPFGT